MTDIKGNSIDHVIDFEGPNVQSFVEAQNGQLLRSCS